MEEEHGEVLQGFEGVGGAAKTAGRWEQLRYVSMALLLLASLVAGTAVVHAHGASLFDPHFYEHNPWAAYLLGGIAAGGVAVIFLLNWIREARERKAIIKERKQVIMRVVGLIALLMLFSSVVGTAVVHAHETEDFVDWSLAFQYVEFLGPPVYIHYKSLEDLQKGVGGVEYVAERGSGPTIKMSTGDILVAKFKFRYIGPTKTRADLFYLTRLGLDFGILGKYVNGKFIGAKSFEVEPGKEYEAMLVLRALRPERRHLHVGVSIEGFGNIAVAPYELPVPVLYGIWTEATGPVVEPLAGINVRPFGELKLLETWPWASASVVAQLIIGFGFIAVMYAIGRRRGT
jgi:hypothetical protein